MFRCKIAFNHILYNNRPIYYVYYNSLYLYALVINYYIFLMTQKVVDIILEASFLLFLKIYDLTYHIHYMAFKGFFSR